MGKAAKQSERNSAKKPVKEVEAEVASGNILDAAKAVALSSCLAQLAPKLPALVKEEVVTAPAEPEKPKEETETNENAENTTEATEETTAATEDVSTPAAIFVALKSRLVWHNGLGLMATDEESKSAWLAMKGQELDFGPRAKRIGSPGIERMSANLAGNLSQYVAVLFALMLVRSFVFRSFFACLPWLFFYQFVSLYLPLETMEKFGQKIPLEKVAVNFRAAGTIGIHALVWLFFLYELVWRTYFLEKFLLAGVVLYHSYAVRPVEVPKAA
jgi:hypothetical protein